MAETKRILEVHHSNDSLKITYDQMAGEFELAFDPELDAYTGGSQKILYRLILKADTVRQMCAVLPPPDPETVH